MQHAVEPEEILQVVTEERPNLKAAHLAAALLRLGKGLVQPRDAERRQRLVETVMLQELVCEALGLITTAGGVRHAHDALLGMALLEFPLLRDGQQDVRAAVERLFHDATLLGGGGPGFERLAPGEVSGLAWSWTKMGLEHEALPAAFRDRLATFPFRVRIGALKGAAGDDLLDLSAIIEEVALRRDSVTVGSKGIEIEESRLTAWQGPKPFFYSEKEMAPSPMTPRVAAIRDRLFQVTGIYHDCVLVNLYEDGKVGMRYHIDPDQGVLWSTNTAVVSIGDTREFCIRDIETKGQREHHRFFVSAADAVEMIRDCQEKYQHCVKVCAQADDAGPRISLVYKQSLELMQQQQATGGGGEGQT